MWTPLASASVVFLVLYTIIFVLLTSLYIGKRIKFASRWTVIYSHVILRLAAQATGLAFGVSGYKAIGVLIAYFVLGAEGYFTLVLCTMRYLVSWHNHHYGDSWLERKPSESEAKDPWYLRLANSFRLNDLKQNPLAIMHWLLIGANVIIITGGSQTAGAYGNEDITEEKRLERLETARIMRAVGQGIFLSINVALFGCIVYTVIEYRRKRRSSVQESSSTPWYGHPTLLILLITWPFLATRGSFGIVQAVVPEANFFSEAVYDERGLTQKFVIEESILATMPEWVSCALLIATYLTDKDRTTEQTSNDHKLESGAVTPSNSATPAKDA